MKYSHVFVWFAVTFSVTVYGEIEFLHRRRNESVKFTCVSKKVDKPFALSLYRDWMLPAKVLYYNLDVHPVIHDKADRISVEKNQSPLNVTVSITNLRGADTNLYSCVFFYERPTHFYNDTVKFFLYVEDPVREPCICKALVYSLSAASGLLFLCVLGFAVTIWKKPSSQPKALAVPVYEEMNGVHQTKARDGNGFLSLLTEDSTHGSLYSQPHKENPYTNAQNKALCR